MGGVKGIVVDGWVVLEGECDSLLFHLRHSNIPTAISYHPDLSPHQVSVLKTMIMPYSFDHFVLDASSIEDSMNKITQAWGENGGSVLYVVSKVNDNLFLKLSNWGWLIVVQSVDVNSANMNPNLLYINKLEELPLTICHLNKKAADGKALTVGYTMKLSRKKDFAKRGAFPMSPTPNGLIFMPLTFELPLSTQLEEVDVILHKATDEIISIELSTPTSGSNHIITYTAGMQELERYLEDNPTCCVIDPVKDIYPVLDRLQIQQILLGLEDLNKEGHDIIRAPHFLKIDSFKEPNLLQRLLEAKLSLPTIVKPQVACGVADAHSMAIVFKVEDYKDLSVPLPAVVQEYVDHSSSLFKFYVLGEKVFYANKKSTPNADVLITLSEKSGLKPLLFDSLKSLPISVGKEKEEDVVINVELVTDAAYWLRRNLHLTIFGFDVVIQQGSGDHVIVDVNYLPSFKEVADHLAIPAFWDAITLKYQSFHPASHCHDTLDLHT